MSFKNLGDRRRKQALESFLLAANLLNGICVSFVIHKEIKFLCANPQQVDDFIEEFGLEGKWNAKSLDHLIRLTHFISLLIAGLSQPKQNVYWISDEGSFFANTACCEDVTQLTSCLTSYYVKHKLGELGIGTTQIDNPDLMFEDLTAIPDLVAGAVADLTTKISAKYGGKMPVGLALAWPNTLSHKVRSITDWIADDNHRLKRPIVVFDLANNNQMRIFRFRLS